MAKEFVTSDKLAFREIILDHLVEILKIMRKEFKGGHYEEKIRENYIEKYYVGNTRAEFNQAVEGLSDVLLPFFDDTMKKKHKEICAKVDKIKEGLEEEELKLTSFEYSKKKLVFMRELFQQLNLLLHRRGYLKGAIYSEGDLEGEE